MRKFLKKRLPWLARALNENYNYLVYYKYKNQPLKRIFEDIYAKNHWKDPDSISGTGSNLLQTETIREQIPGLINDLNIKKLLDLPCGDFFWFDRMDLKVDQYVGGDIVEDIIKLNNEKYGSDRRKFLLIDITKDTLPGADLIFCRDCLVHFSYDDIFKAIENIKSSDARYLLTTTFTERQNRNIITGSWRRINLQSPPFNFPEPVMMINENCIERDGENSDKSLGLWKIADL